VPDHVEDITMCRDKAFIRTKETTQLSMDALDSIQIETTYDLTGTHIYSDKPITVIVGSRNVTNGDVIAHTVEQLVPSSHWGTEFVLKNLGTSGYGDIIKMVSSWPNTAVEMNGYKSFEMTTARITTVKRLDQGYWTYIKASNPIQVILTFLFVLRN